MFRHLRHAIDGIFPRVPNARKGVMLETFIYDSRQAAIQAASVIAKAEGMWQSIRPFRLSRRFG
jgi:hypothetical protein